VENAAMSTHVAINYSVAVEFADAIRAFAIIESGENEHQVGDGGQAYGLLQMHPATFKRYYGSQTRFAAGVRDTWTEAQIKACAAFLLAHQWREASAPERDLIVMAWNLGEAAVFIDRRRNDEYLERWKSAYARVV
jgi:hypothetical protein